MLTKNVEVKLKIGLQAKSAAEFVQEANRYRSDIFLEMNGRRVNAKSIMGLMSFAIGPGTPIKIIADGSDEEEAVEALAKIVEQEK